jgi:AcrR family transcriptional regulator
MPRGRYQQKQWEARQQAILEALQALSAAQGFATVTMDDLAEAVGISKATLYQHFASKDAMLAALIAGHSAQFLDWLAATADLPPFERLRRTLRYLMTEHITPLRGLINVGREEVIPVFERDPALQASHDRTLAHLTAIIEQGQADGSIAPDLTPRTIISAMWGLSNVSMREHKPLDRTQPIPTTEDHIQQMITLFERAIRPPQPTEGA